MKTLILSLIAILLSFCSCYNDSSKLEDKETIALFATNCGIEVIVMNEDTAYTVSNQDYYYNMSKFLIKNTSVVSKYLYIFINQCSDPEEVLLEPGGLKMFNIEYYPQEISIYDGVCPGSGGCNLGRYLLTFTCYSELR
jgi:hypothetical protein